MTNDKRLTGSAIAAAAKKLDVPVATIHAVIAVESYGIGTAFLPDGRVRVQYEPHVMYRRLRDKFGRERADRALREFPKLVARAAGSYQSSEVEDRDMDAAARFIDRQCALESASWGLFQIMGYHWRFLGFSTLQDFVNAMYRDEAAHLDAFCRFVLAQPAMHANLKKRNWAAFARMYNGPAYVLNRYDVKLAQAYRDAVKV